MKSLQSRSICNMVSLSLYIITLIVKILIWHIKVSSSLHTCSSGHTKNKEEDVSGHSTSQFTQILCESYSPFCFWCVKETTSREKWQQQSHCGRVIRKESRLTHGGGAVVNEHTSKKQTHPPCARCDSLLAATSAFAFNHIIFEG